MASRASIEQTARTSRHSKLLARILRGGADANIGFDELCGLLRALGFAERTGEED